MVKVNFLTTMQRGMILLLFSITFFFALPPYFGDFRIFFVLIVFFVGMAFFKSRKR